MKYEELRKINVNEHIEKKNGSSYLSWAWAVDQLLTLDETAQWEYLEPKAYGDTLMVFCTVTAFGRSRTAQLPVMDHRNKAVSNPDAFQVNTAMQRCLAKAISLHGIGLYIYAGEDLPPDAEQAKEISKHTGEVVLTGTHKPSDGAAEALTDEQVAYLKQRARAVSEAFFQRTVEEAYQLYEAAKADFDKEDNRTEAHAYLRSLLESQVRTGLRKFAEGAK